MSEPTLAVVTDSAAAMAALMGGTINPSTGALTALPGTQGAPAAAAEGTPATPPTAAELVSLTGPEAIAKVNELLAAVAEKDALIATKEAEANDWKAQSRRNERAKREARRLLAEAGGNAGSAGADDTDDSGVHTDDQDDAAAAATSTLRQENMRLRAALAAGLAESDANRLVGDTPEALKADAEAFKKRIAPSMRPSGRADGGAGVTLKVLTPAQEMAAVIGQALGR
jgi:hypothetical protein